MLKTFRRMVMALALGFALVGAPVFAQEGTTQPETAVTQPAETNDDNGFPWGLLGLLGLGGLAGLNRRQEPQRVATVDASRR